MLRPGQQFRLVDGLNQTNDLIKFVFIPITKAFLSLHLSKIAGLGLAITMAKIVYTLQHDVNL